MSLSPVLGCSGTSLWRAPGGDTLTWMDERCDGPNRGRRPVIR
jgi:hypothetical protein